MARISLVIPTLTGGGMERVLSELSNHLHRRGHEVHLICLIKHRPFYDIDSGIKIYFPRFEYEKVGKLKKLFYWIRILQYLRKTIIEINPDSIFSIPQGYSNLTILSTLGLRIPVFISDRNSPAKKVSPLKNFLRKRLYPLATGIICQTTFAKEALLKAGIKNRNIAVIPNPVKHLVEYSKKSNSKKIVLNVGRFVAEKNQTELIRIFSKIDNPDWVLHIVGDGPLKEKLNDEIRHNRLEDRVKLIAPVREIELVLSQADIFAFTSIYEGFPNALNEAMAYPLPCIAYDCIAGPRDIIDNDKNGILVQQGDFDMYIDKLNELMSNPVLRSNLQANAVDIRNRYSIDTIGDCYMRFILNTRVV